MNTQETLELRQSCRSFTDEKVSKEDLDFILKAAQNSPVAGGEAEKMHITVVKSEEKLEALRSLCMMERDGQKFDPFYNGQLFILVSAKKLSDDHIEYADTACIIENMTIAATSLGLASCYIWGATQRKIKPSDDACELLELPKNCTPMSGLIIRHAKNELKPRKDFEQFEVKQI